MRERTANSGTLCPMMKTFPEAPTGQQIAPILMGALDASVFITYLFNIEIASFYFTTLAIKILVFIKYRRQAKLYIVEQHLDFIFLLVAAETMTVLIWGGGNIFRVVGFSGSLITSLPFVRRQYFWAITVVCLLDATLYLSFWVAGLIPPVWGRFFYFGGTHPNLGSEIFYAGAVAAILTNNNRLILAAAPLMTIPIILMQGRAALLGCLILFSGYLLRGLSRLPRAALSFFAIILAIPLLAFLLLYSDFLVNYFRSVFLLDDAYRGAGTGVVGRDEHWAYAIQAFLDNPIFGAGSDYSERTGVPQAHNFVLWALASYGALGAILLLLLATKVGRAFFFSSNIRLILASWTPLFLFNDRFANLNLYPFLIYVIVMAASVREHSRYSVQRRLPGHS